MKFAARASPRLLVEDGICGEAHKLNQDHAHGNSETGDQKHDATDDWAIGDE